MLAKCSLPERILLIGGAVGMIIPGTVTDLIGMAMVAVGVYISYRKRKKLAAAA